MSNTDDHSDFLNWWYFCFSFFFFFCFQGKLWFYGKKICFMSTLSRKVFFSGDRLRPIFTIASFCPTVFSPEMLQATDLACLARKLLREKRHYGINEQHICRF